MLPYTQQRVGAHGVRREARMVEAGMPWRANRRRREDWLCVVGCCVRVCTAGLCVRRWNKQARRGEMARRKQASGHRRKQRPSDKP